MIANCRKPKVAHNASYLFIPSFKMLSSINVAEIGIEFIAAAANDKIKPIATNYHCYHSPSIKS